MTVAEQLRAAQDDLQRLRGQLAQAVGFIHDSAYDETARRALAMRLNVPQPTATKSRGDR